MGETEDARTGQCLIPDYETCVQHGVERVYGMVPAAPRPGFTKATVSAWRVPLEERRLGSSSIIIRMSAIRKLAAEAADNGLLAPELAQGISRVKSVKSTGIRVGNWLSQRQAQALLSLPDITTIAGVRDRAILAVLLGCGLRRSEVAALTFGQLSTVLGSMPVYSQDTPKPTTKWIRQRYNRQRFRYHSDAIRRCNVILQIEAHASGCTPDGR